MREVRRLWRSVIALALFALISSPAFAIDDIVNGGRVTLAGGYDGTATSIGLTSGGGALLGTPPFNCNYYNATDYASDPTSDPGHEFVTVTGKTGNTLAIERSKENTNASAHNTAGKVYKLDCGLTQKTLLDIAAEFAGPRTVVTGGSGTNSPLSGILKGNGSSPYSAIPLAGDATKFLNETGVFSVPAGGSGGGGDALVANPLSQFAATTSAQLRSVLSDETGTGPSVFGTAPTITSANLTNPTIGVATGTSLTLSALAGNGTRCVQTDNSGALAVASAGCGAGSGSGDALVANPLSQFAATTSAQLAAVLSDETGTGVFVRNISPSFTTPNLGTPSTLVLTNATALPLSGLSGLGANVATLLGVFSSTNLAAALTDETGTGPAVMANNPILVAPVLGTPQSVTLTNGIGLPLAGITGFSTGISAFLANPTSANFAAAVSDETGGGTLVLNNAPTLIAPVLGVAAATSITVSSLGGTGTRCLQTDNAGFVTVAGSSCSGAGGGGDALTTSGLSQFASTTSAQLAGVLSDETGTGVFVRNISPSFTTPNLGTPSALVLTNATSLPLAGLSGLATNMATFLGASTSANLAAALTDETGTGPTVMSNNPVLVAPALGTPASGNMANVTNVPIATGVSGLAANVAAFLATPSSANFAAALTNKTGTGVFALNISPAFTTPALGAATATSINGLTITSSNGVLTIPNGVTVTGPASSGTLLSTAAAVTVPQGGLGTVTLTAHGVVIGEGTATASVTSAGAANTVFLGAGASTDPGFGPLTNAYIPTDLPLTTLTTGSTIAAYGGTYFGNCASACTQVLPTAVGHGNATIAFVIGPSSKLVTLDGAGTETIGGQLTRIYHNGESIELESDGANWFTLNYHGIPLTAFLRRTTDQTGVAVNTWTPVVMTGQVSGYADMFDSGNGRVTVVRPGIYDVTTGMNIDNISDMATMWISVGLNAPQSLYAQSPSTNATGGTASLSSNYSSQVVAAVGDYIAAGVYTNGVAGSGTVGVTGGVSYPFLLVREVLAQ